MVDLEETQTKVQFVEIGKQAGFFVYIIGCNFTDNVRSDNQIYPNIEIGDPSYKLVIYNPHGLVRHNYLP